MRKKVCCLVSVQAVIVSCLFLRNANIKLSRTKQAMTTQQELVPVAGAKAFPLLWVLGISWDFLGIFLGARSSSSICSWATAAGRVGEPGQGAKKPGGSSVALGPDRSPRAGQGQPRAAKKGPRRTQETAKIKVRAVVDSDLPRRDEEIGGLSPRRPSYTPSPNR
jgi:hypothetical protein